MAAAEGASCGGFVVLAAMQTIVVDVAAGENFQLDPEARAGRALKPPANGRPTITAAVQPLMISGQADQMSSPKLAEIAVRRAQKYNFPFPLEHLSYPDAGHMVANLPYLPTTVRHTRHPIRGVDVDLGGTSAGD